MEDCSRDGDGDGVKKGATHRSFLLILKIKIKYIYMGGGGKRQGREDRSFSFFLFN